MIFTIALRSLQAHPIRSAVLACGFGFGVAVMAILLGVGEVILVQARSPVLVGGGDLVITAATGKVTSARYILSSVLQTPPLAGRAVLASPQSRATLYVVRHEGNMPIRARGGIPSLERALADPETAAIASWIDAPVDATWSSPDPGDVLRAMDRFHAAPDVPGRAGSWAEWLYFNGRAGDTRFYLTFLVGPKRQGGQRTAGVRLQLDRGGRAAAYSDSAELEEADVLATAPDLTIGRSGVRLVGRQYRVTLDLREELGIGGEIRAGAAEAAPHESGRKRRAGLQPRRGSRGRLTGEIILEAQPGRSLPPLSIRGAGGWVSGYVVPVMSGALDGSLAIDGQPIPLSGGVGYHDHNWGFWEGVAWRWGQVQHEDLSIVYGRVYPPSDAADPDRIPGFLGVIGPDGPIGYSTNVSIEETDDPGTGRPRHIVVRGRSGSLDLTMGLTIEDVIVTRMRQGGLGSGFDFLQLRARYRVVGRAGEKSIDFTAYGAAETFRDEAPAR